MSIADPKQIGTNREGYSFAFVNKGDPLAGCDIDGAVDTVNNVQGPYLRIDKYLWILAADDSEIFVSDLLFNCNNVAKTL